LRLMAAMRPYWLMRGLLRLGLQTTTEALKRADPSTSDAAMAGSLIALSQLAHFTGKYGEAEQYAQRGLAVARRIEHVGWTSLALRTLPSIARVHADFMAAGGYLEA